MTQAEVGLLGESDDIIKKYEYISTKAKVISHDIKNHLSVIDLYSKIMEKRLEIVANAELHDSITNAISSIKKAKDAIEVLLTELRTIQSVKLETLNFAQILQNAINLVNAKAQQTGVKFEVSNQYNGNILADENKLLNVMINLFYNAIDAVKENGTIKIKTEETSDNMLKILITDNGCGIEKDKCSKVFEEGYTSKVTGSGLGLYISKEAMQEQYGDLKLISSDENGTTFEITVPKL